MTKKYLLPGILLLAAVLGGCAQTAAPTAATAATIEHSQNAYTLSARSSSFDKESAYVMFSLMAAESEDLSPYFAENSEETLSFQNIIAIPSANNTAAAVAVELFDDEDGKDNTLGATMTITPTPSEDGKSPFRPKQTCRISVDAIAKCKKDQELTPQILDDTGWEFIISFSDNSCDGQELLTEPASACGMVSRSDSKGYPVSEQEEPLTLRSLVLKPHSLSVQFDKPSPGDNVSSVFLTDCLELVLKNGKRISYFQSIGAVDQAAMTTDYYISPEEIDCIQFSNGLKIPVNF